MERFDPEALYLRLLELVRPAVTPETALVGIYTGGVWIAERLHSDLSLSQPLGTIDVSFYRDDYGRAGLHPNAKRSDLPFDVADRPIIVVDDVLYTGRTIRAALNELFDYGRPARVDLAVLADRGERELPIAPRWCAAEIPVPQGKRLQLDRDDDSGRFSFRLIDV